MGKKDGGASEMARQDRADEQARQQRIRAGTSQINSIFDGGTTTGVGKIAAGTAYDPSKTYYKADGSLWTPPEASAQPGAFVGAVGQIIGLNSPDSQRAAFDNALNEGLYGSVSRTGGQFNDDFYTKQRQNYIDYATPQLEDQFGDARKQLTYALTRGNLLDSSARADLEGQLQKKYDLNKQQIADQALSYETQARNSVEDSRSQLISMLNSTGDADAAAKQALSRASALSQGPSYSALSDLFSDFTSALGTQAALERANHYSGGQTGARYNTGLFAPNNNSVQVR